VLACPPAPPAKPLGHTPSRGLLAHVKFYVYIADAKLDRLLAALSSEDRQRLACEIDVEPRLLDLPEVRHGDPDECRFARATAVARHLEQTGAAATLDVDSAYIADQGDVRWGRIRLVRGSELVRHETESPVSFGFANPSRELLMAGSASMLLAQPPAAKVETAAPGAGTAFPWFALAARASDFDDVDQRCLEQAFEGALPPLAASDAREWPAELRALASKPLSARRLSSTTLATLETLPWMNELASLRRDFSSLPQGRLEFLAKRLATFVGGTVDPETARFQSAPTVIIASPLYVAMTL
jgi:hypothetical protein